MQGVMSSPGREGQVQNKRHTQTLNPGELERPYYGWERRDWCGDGQRGPGGKSPAFLLWARGKLLKAPALKGPLWENWES